MKPAEFLPHAGAKLLSLNSFMGIEKTKIKLSFNEIPLYGVIQHMCPTYKHVRTQRAFK